MLRAARFVHAYLRPGPPPRSEEVRIPVGGHEVEGTLYLPPGAGPHPGWVVLHGMTVPGRRHAALLRFAHSVAAAGMAVLVPDVPSWRALRLDTRAAGETLAASTLFLDGRPEVRPGGVGLVGFSFGATQALISAADPRLRHALRAVVGFGGYHDLRRTARCMLTGEHEWRGVEHRLDPDPYGRWIIAGNYLARARGYEGMERVAEAAHRLAVEAGLRGAFAGEAEYDPLKREVREGLGAEERRVWDLLAPPAGVVPRGEEARALADALAEAALEADPALDPAPALPHLHGRIVLAHGQADRLIPYTESLRLWAALPPTVDASLTVTRLFAHSTGNAALRALEYAWEGARFVRLMHRALSSV